MRETMMAVLAGVLTLGAVVRGAPALLLEPAVFTWERQAENKGSYDFAFTVKNTGDEDLLITRVRPGCPSCTKLTMEQRTLKPGESTQLTGTLTTVDVEGTMNRIIFLSSNDPAQPTVKAGLSIRLPFQAQGLRLKGMAPPVQVRKGVFRTTVIVQNCEPEGAATITAMELPEGWVCEQRLPVTVPAEEHVTLVLRGDALPTSTAGAAFTVVSDSARTPRLQGTLSTPRMNLSRRSRQGPSGGLPRRRRAADGAGGRPAAPSDSEAAPAAPSDAEAAPSAP